jgi:hypothetical protein
MVTYRIWMVCASFNVKKTSKIINNPVVKIPEFIENPATSIQLAAINIEKSYL